MKRRRWDSKTKTKLVLEGLSEDARLHLNKYMNYKKSRRILNEMPALKSFNIIYIIMMISLF
jgi:uncharacterized protein YjiS (DUF1127 family)